MLKRFVVLMAAMSFVAACAKKSDDNSAVAAAAPTNPVPATTAPAAPGTTPGGSPAADTLAQNLTSGGASTPDIVLSEQYSGAADDPMNQFLTNEMARVKDAGQQAANLNRAHEILKASLQRHADGRINVVVTLLPKAIPETQSQSQAKSQQAGKAQKPTPKAQDRVMNLTGRLDNQGEAKLKSLSSQSQSLKITGSFKCLDENASNICNTSLVSLDFVEAGKTTTAMILFRTSDAIFNVKFPEDDITDASYAKLVRLFKNTEYMLQGEDNSLKLIRMDSVEIINGRSNMTLSLLSRENELIQFKFPLLKQAEDQKLELAIDKKVDPKEALEITGSRSFRSKISDSLTEVTLSENSGRGDVTFLVKMKALQNATTKTIKMTFKRHIKNVVF